MLSAVNTSVDVDMFNDTESGFFDTPCDNDYSLEITRFIVQKILVPFITSIGFVGNFLCIVVLTHKSMVSSTNCYLTALAIFDISYLMFSFTLTLKHFAAVNSLAVYTYWYPHGKTLTDICSNVSVWLTVTFSLERLIVVCYPLKGRLICTPQRAKIITLSVVIFAVVSTFPEFFEVKTVNTEINSTVLLRNIETDFANTGAYKIVYYHYLVFTFTFLPFVLLSIFNGILVKTIYSARKIRKRMTQTSASYWQTARRQMEQNRITVMLIGVVVVFLLCQSPNAALLLYLTYLEYKDKHLTACDANNLIIAGNIVNLLILINASINFILYSVMSTKFRRVFVRLICFCEKYGLDIFTKTETSLDNGHTLKQQDIPLRLISRRPYRYDYSPNVRIQQNTCRNRRYHQNGHHDQKKPLTSFKTSRSSSSSQNKADSSNCDGTFTPIVMRKTNKQPIIGSTHCHRFRSNGNSKSTRHFALSEKRGKLQSYGTETYKSVKLIKLSLNANVSILGSKTQDTNL